MTDAEKLVLMEERLFKLKQSPKNTKSPGVVKSLERKVRNLKEKMGITN